MATSNTEYVHLSFEEFLNDSLDCFNSIRTTSKKLEQTRESFYENIAFLKKSYRMRSTEDEKVEDKKTFGRKIKEFFLKIWTFLVSIFSKIVELVVSLIKTIIIFIQKKRVQMNSIFKMFEKDGGIKGFNNTNSNVVLNMLTGGEKIDTIYIGNIEYNHNLIYSLLTRTGLQKFCDLKIKASRTSAASIDYFKSVIDEATKANPSNASKIDDEIRKLSILKNAVDNLYISGVLLNEAAPSDVSASGAGIKLYIAGGSIDLEDISRNGKVDEMAHMIVFGSPSVARNKMSLIDYFKGSLEGGKNMNWAKMDQHFKEYYDMSQKVVGNGGYIEKLEKTLKEYKELAKKDHKLISEMNKAILAEVDKYLDQETPEAKSKISYYDMITKLVLKVKNIKTHFIRLRQQVIIDIITLYSIENKAWWKVCNNGKYLKGTAYKEGDDNISEYNIIKRPEETV